MKIAVIGPEFPDSFARNISSTLQQMGHQVFSTAGTRHRHNQGRLQSAFWHNLPKLFPVLHERSYARLYGQISEFRPALVLVTSDFFAPSIVARLKSAAQAPVVCWYIDPIANLHGGRIFFCAYDAIFCKEPRLVQIMRDKLSLPANYLPEACNPQWHRPTTPSPEQMKKYQCDIAAQGTFHPYRAKFFEALLDYDVRIWGSSASVAASSPSKRFFQGEYIAENEKAAAFNSAKILVNNMNFTEVDGVNNTLFEAAGCGAFQICDASPTVSEFFQPDEEVIVFRNRKELLEKINHFLARDDDRLRIGMKASERAHKHHTYQHRLSDLLSTIGLQSH